jgi:hypothetical protein
MFDVAPVEDGAVVESALLPDIEDEAAGQGVSRYREDNATPQIWKMTSNACRTAWVGEYVLIPRTSR